MSGRLSEELEVQPADREPEEGSQGTRERVRSERRLPQPTGRYKCKEQRRSSALTGAMPATSSGPSDLVLPVATGLAVLAPRAPGLVPQLREEG